nr:CMRF35-like molecule 7 [Odocoileus virginianus texanus]
MWLPPALLLLSIPGCLSIQGPESVQGQERESVSVQCRYDSEWESHKKWWCRGEWWASCRILVQTQGSGREEKGDRVSIRDDQRNHSFTVTMQELRQDDADTYWCGIERPGTDLGTQIKVTVGPREAVLTVLESQDSRTRTTSPPAASSRPHSRTHYMLLVFLKVPFLLGLVGAVLWLEEHRRDIAEPQGQPIYANLSSELLTRDTPV